MDRGILHLGGTPYRFTVECFDTAGLSVALDSAPTIVVVKNGTPTMDAVTAVDRNSDGKHYDCSYVPSVETTEETDHYEIRVTVEISAVEYVRPSEHFDVVARERGTNNAYTGTPPTIEEIAGEVWSSVSRSLTDKADFGLSSAAIAAIEASLVNEGDATALLQAIADKIAGDLTAGDLTALAIVSAIKADETLAQMIARIDASITSRLAAVSYASPLDATQTQAACAAAISSYDPPTKAEQDSAFTEIKGAGWSASTDTLEAIRDRGDAAWTTGGGGGGTSAEDLADAMRIEFSDELEHLTNLPTLPQIQENAVFVLPISYQQQSQLQGAWIRRAIGDASPMELRALKDANGTALNLTGKTLKLYIMTAGKTPALVQTILNADLEVFGSHDSVRFTPSSTVVGTVRKLLLSLRVVTTTEQEIVPGGIEIYRTAWTS